MAAASVSSYRLFNDPKRIEIDFKLDSNEMV